MSWWERIKAASSRFDKSVVDSVRAGGVFDLRTYKGCIRFFLASAAVTYFLWHLHDLFAWERSIFGIPYEIDRAKQRWAQLWAWIIGVPPMALAILGMILIPIRRHLARKSAKGQWYDNPHQTEQDLNDGSDAAKNLD